MAKRKSTQNLLELGALLIVILIPIGLVAYAYWNSTMNSTPSVPTTSTQTTTQTIAATPPTATISLDNPSSLPSTTTVAQLVPFSFTITNTGNVSGSIPFKVSVKWSTGEDDVIDENVVSLQAGQSTSINEQLKFEIATETAEISLELTQSGQTVEFALPKSAK